MIHQNGALRTDVSDRYGPSVYVDHIVDFMKRNKDRPFFAFYSMALCHDVTDDLKQPVPYARNKDHYDTFAEMMAQMDIHVGRVTAAIRRLGLEKDTLVLFTTDNGTAKRSLHQAIDGKFIRRPVSSRIGDKLVPGGKGNLSDDGTHVPLLASWPGRISPGTTTDHLVDMSDFLPTFRELAGKTLSARDRVKIDGQSFAGVLVGRGGRGRRWAYAERGTRRFFVRTQSWKLYNNGKLYHIPRDINEKSPVALNRAPTSAAADIRLLQQAIATIDDGHAFPNRTKN